MEDGSICRYGKWLLMEQNVVDEEMGQNGPDEEMGQNVPGEEIGQMWLMSKQRS